MHFSRKKKFLQIWFFSNSVIAQDMRRSYSVWCNLSQKYFLQTCSFSYFSNCRRRVTAILTVMQLSQIFFLQTCFIPNSVIGEDMRRSYSVWCNFSQKYLLQTCSFSNSVLTEDVRRPISGWCNNSWQKSDLLVVSPNSVFTEDMQTQYSVWCNFSHKYFLQIWSISYFSNCRRRATAILSVMQLSQIFFLQTCFFPNSVIGEDMRRSYSVWSNFLESTFYRPVLFPNSVIAEDMRRSYSVWCNLSQKYFLQTCSFSYFSNCRRRVTAILTVMQLSQIFFLQTCFIPNSVIGEDMRRSYSVWSNFLESTFYRPVLFPNSVIAEDMRRPYSVWSNNTRKKSHIPVVSPTSVFAEVSRTPYSVWCNFSHKYFLQIWSISYFSNCRRRATAILSVMQLSQIFFLQTCFFPNSVIGEDMRRPYSVWCNFSQKYFYRPVLFLIQYLQRTCYGQTQCDAITLDKSLTYLLFLLLQFLQRTRERHTQFDAIYLTSTFYRPVLFPISVIAEDVRRPYSVWCNCLKFSFTHLFFS